MKKLIHNFYKFIHTHRFSHSSSLIISSCSRDTDLFCFFHAFGFHQSASSETSASFHHSFLFMWIFEIFHSPTMCMGIDFSSSYIMPFRSISSNLLHRKGMNNCAIKLDDSIYLKLSKGLFLTNTRFMIFHLTLQITTISSKFIYISPIVGILLMYLFLHAFLLLLLNVLSPILYKQFQSFLLQHQLREELPYFQIAFFHFVTSQDLSF